MCLPAAVLHEVMSPGRSEDCWYWYCGQWVFYPVVIFIKTWVLILLCRTQKDRAVWKQARVLWKSSITAVWMLEYKSNIWEPEIQNIILVQFLFYAFYITCNMFHIIIKMWLTANSRPLKQANTFIVKQNGKKNPKRFSANTMHIIFYGILYPS